VKLVEFQEQNKKHLKAKINKLETNSKSKNIRDSHRGIDGLKKGYQPRINVVKRRMVIWLQTPTVFWLGGGIISPRC
jgi:hypothetical protein